jgi:hypothetical protein
MAKNLKPNKKIRRFLLFFLSKEDTFREKRKKEKKGKKGKKKKEKRKEKSPMLGPKWMDHEMLKRCDKSTSFLFVLVVVVCGWVENTQIIDVVSHPLIQPTYDLLIGYLFAGRFGY